MLVKLTPVLGECASLVRAYRGRGAQRFDGFQVLDEAIFRGHPPSSHWETHCNGGNETFGNVGNDHPNQEDRAIQPRITLEENEA